MEKLSVFLEKLEKNSIVVILRRGFLAIVPFIIIGSFCLLLASFPLEIYQNFIQTFANGLFYNIFNLLYKYTANTVSLMLVASISYSFAKKYDSRRIPLYLIVAFSSYCIFVGSANRKISFELFEPSYTLTAVLVTLLSCLYLKFVLKLTRKKDKTTFESFHYDMQYVNSFSMLLKIFAVIVVFALAGAILGYVAPRNGIENLCSFLFTAIFEHIGRNFFGVIVYSFIVHILWFFGIHGSNAMADVSSYLFQNTHIAEDAARRASSDIFSASFYDTFVTIGGSGMVLALVIAIIICSHNKNNRRLAFSSIVPAIFNISEPVVFGLPIIFNPVLLIPFVLVPIVVSIITTIAFALGFVPIADTTVSWTTPILISGYIATGSITGSILQLVNLAAGILIYMPFVKKMDEPQMDMVNKYMSNIIGIVNECESMGINSDLLSGSSNVNIAAQKLLVDMYSAMDNNEIHLCYQPQINDQNQIIGAEGLMRWKHPSCGYIYPPLVIHLAYEDHCLYYLTMKLIDESAKALDDLVKRGAHHFKMSVNISTLELENKEFCETVENIISVYNFGDCILAFEITERLALTATPFIEKSIERLRKMGIEIIMDDFGMGHSSMSYLQDNRFSYVKIDGSLVKQILSNERSCDIVETVCELSQKLGFEVIAEYVETEQQKNKLLSMGCKIYQGYLYSPAINYEAFLKYMKRNGGFNNSAIAEKEEAPVENSVIGDGSFNQQNAAERAVAAVQLANVQLEEDRQLLENAHSVDDARRAAAAITAAKRNDAMNSDGALSIINKTQSNLAELMQTKEDEDNIKQLIEEQATIDAAIMEKSRMARARDHQFGLTSDYDRMKNKEKQEPTESEENSES